MDKINVVDPQNGQSLATERNEIAIHCHNMDKHYASRKKPVIDFKYYMILCGMTKIGKSVGITSILKLPGARGKEKWRDRYIVSNWGDENVLEQTVMTAAQPCEQTKNNGTVYLKDEFYEIWPNHKHITLITMPASQFQSQECR